MRVSHTAIPSQAPSASEADTTQALSHICSYHHQDGMPAFSGPTDVMTESQQRQRPGRRHCHDVQTAEKYTDRDTGRSRRLVSSTNRWLRHRLPRASLVFSSVILIFLATLCAQPVEAAQINFENCLPDNYRYNNNPVLLQFVPLYVDAVFDTENPTHSLRVTAYGNVTGTNTNEPLPAWNSSDWRDPKMTLGKILRDPNPNGPDPKLTTLHSKVNVLTYEPWNGDFDFCNTALVNASCPLGPVFNTTVLAPYQLPSFNLTQNFYSSYAFTSFSATFLIKYGDAGTDIGCVSATITPDLGDLVWMLKILPVVILLVVGFATIFAAVFSPWGSTDIFHWSSNYGRDADILRLVTPGFGDCLGYIQFIVLTGGLTLNYPGFFQPIVSQAAWSALMFNETFVSKAPGLTSLVDGIYVTNGQYGLQHIAQLVGMEEAEDVWAGMMVWLLVIIAGTFVVCQLGFGLQWVYRFIRHIPEEDLRAKNVPFSVGNVIRIAFNYFLLPLVALSTFQLVLAGSSPAYTVALAAITVVVLLGFAIWLLYLIVSTKPRAVLFDDLPTVLLYGPLYNTYSDEAAAFAMIPLLLTFVRGIAIGGVQPSGVAQVVILAICEVVQILTIHAFRPFHTKSSMNAYHTLFASLRIASVLLMIAFVPQLGVTEGARGWVGYVILVIHAGVLILGFLLNAIQTILEVVARLLGAGNDDIRGQTRGGLSKIFGMRQLSRRMPRRNAGPSRQSNLSTTAMLDEEASKTGYVMPSGRVRSESAGSIGVLLNNRGKRSSSALDFTSVDVPFAPRILDSGASSFTPTTPGEISTFSFLPSPGGANRNSMPPASAAALEAGDPFYRQPRRTRRQTIDTRDTTASPADKTRGSWASADWSVKRNSQAGASLMPEITTEAEPPVSRAATPAPAAAQPAISFAPRADYSTREVDFYYGVRGERLNSDAPSRKLGTGPADPTGPMASAAGWFKTFLGGKTKEKGKGFEVVRSSRMPPAMKARGGDFAEDGPPEGIPVAMGVLRNGPIESDDEDEAKRKKAEKAARLGRANGEAGSTELLDEDGNPQEDNGDEVEMSRIPDAPPMLPGIDIGEEIRLPSRIQSKSSRYTAHTAARDVGDDDIPDVPEVPRKSSRRTPTHSRGPSLNLDTHFESTGGVYGQHLAPGAGGSSSRLPFERTGSQKRLSSGSSLGATTTEEMSQIDLHDSSDGGGGGGSGNGVGQERRPASFGHVQQGSVNRIDPDHRGQVNLHGTSAEVVDEHERK